MVVCRLKMIKNGTLLYALSTPSIKYAELNEKWEESRDRADESYRVNRKIIGWSFGPSSTNRNQIE